MDVCKCIVPLRPGGTLNSRRAASPLVWLLEEVRWEASDHPQSVLPLNWDETEPNRTVTCMVLKATANDGRHLALCHDEFREPDLAFVNLVALVTTRTGDVYTCKYMTAYLYVVLKFGKCDFHPALIRYLSMIQN
ncbi:uncharacterized protein TNCV_2043971 [Trichonephila clavipes]|nr:uncharacterized protein TNCV_2043971 [Trichonephila clavipes]